MLASADRSPSNVIPFAARSAGTMKPRRAELPMPSANVIRLPKPLPLVKNDGPWVVVVNDREHFGYSQTEALDLLRAGRCQSIWHP